MIMADELEGVWKFLKLTEDEKEQVETDGVKTNSVIRARKKNGWWLNF